MSVPTEQERQESPYIRWLRVLIYGVLALASLLFSILCLLSIVAAPVSLLSLGFFCYRHDQSNYKRSWLNWLRGEFWGIKRLVVEKRV